MKNLALFCLLLIFSCKEKQKTKTASKPNEKTTTLENKKKEEIKYVTAKTGLIFRDKPQGKRLGSFGYGSKLKILKRTGVFQEIKNEGKLLKGEWIEVNTDGTYVFDGFLSEEKPFFKQLKFKNIQQYLYDKVWVPTEFLKTLNRTKSYAEATATLGHNNILFYENNLVNTFDEGQMEELYFKINENCEIHNYNSEKTYFKILSINNSQMLIENSDGLTINYFSVTREMGDDGNFEVVREGIELVTRKWFAGTYRFTDTQTNQSYNTTYTEEGPSLRMFYDDSGSFESIGLSYKILKIVNNTYYIKEIYLDEEDEDAPPKFSKETHTLVKVNN